MKMIYICSPLKANNEHSMDENKKQAIAWCKKASEDDVLPLAPHTIFTQFLDDTVYEEREKGLTMGIELLKKCDEIWVHGNILSEGMVEEIIFSQNMNKPIIAKDMSHETYKDLMAYQGIFKEAFSDVQWEVISTGLDEGLDVSSYAHSELSENEMLLHRDELKNSKNREPYLCKIDEIKQSDIRENEMEYDDEWGLEM